MELQVSRGIYPEISPSPALWRGAAALGPGPGKRLHGHAQDELLVADLGKGDAAALLREIAAAVAPVATAAVVSDASVALGILNNRYVYSLLRNT